MGHRYAYTSYVQMGPSWTRTCDKNASPGHDQEKGFDFTSFQVLDDTYTFNSSPYVTKEFSLQIDAKFAEADTLKRIHSQQARIIAVRQFDRIFQQINKKLQRLYFLHWKHLQAMHMMRKHF